MPNLLVTCLIAWAIGMGFWALAEVGRFAIRKESLPWIPNRFLVTYTIFGWVAATWFVLNN